ncbi:BRCA1-associated RING domain protein 1-like isoform X3 [Zootermopsis nevadensis]|nr:BRCA1-associated RING domain protein 1-like isoform X3 [Zootermopsis nevadensis]XP_021937738.1 BRCA1-associated RING domain protein 1-like isoform X3 [Zootermopsis nevadensis]XP_021937748.1 BRCA1-associated RING domain protein 1-like isoform X3 [Zootermopsis nevadensis]
MCGHFFCKACVRNDKNTCPMCGIPSLAVEITSDRLIANLIMGWRKICSTIGFKSSIDCLDDKKAVCGDKVHAKESEVKNGSGKCSDNKEDIKVSYRTADIFPDRSSLTGEEPMRKKGRRNKGQEPCISDTQKSSTITVVRKSRVFRNSAAKGIYKRNVKGETQLHVACLKGKVEEVKALLLDGANPNTKDYAGWTPLLDAVHYGFIGITELLLKYGAMVNVPGCDNITPLHEAVLNNKLEAVKLLLMYGADPDACDVKGRTPKDISKTEDMETALNSGASISIMKPLIEMKIPSLDPCQIIVFGCGLNKQQHKQLMTLIQQLKLKMVQTYSSEVTHIIVPTDPNNVCSADTDIIQGILQGKWIVNCKWLDVCLKMNELIHPQEFEVKGTSHFPNSEAPKRGRMNADKQLPGIFNGCHIYLAGVGATYMFDSIKLSKTDVVKLIQSGNGVVLTREPDPESIPPKECTVPYHASRSSSLAKCSHYVIYRTGKDEPKLKYNMTHIKSLSVQWLFDCMESFHLMEPM